MNKNLHTECFILSLSANAQNYIDNYLNGVFTLTKIVDISNQVSEPCDRSNHDFILHGEKRTRTFVNFRSSRTDRQ